MTLWDIMYAGVVLFITFANGVTDYLILFLLYINDNVEYFWICFSILIFSHFVYAAIFSANVYKHPAQHECISMVIIFILFYPFGSLLPLIDFIQKIGVWDKYCTILDYKHNKVYYSESLVHGEFQGKWKDKEGIHWISTVQAFAQSFSMLIVQIIFVLNNNDKLELGWIIIISIIFSCLSIVNTFVYQYYLISVDFDVLIFNITCWVADFFGILASITWSVYYCFIHYDFNYNYNDNNNSLSFYTCVGCVHCYKLV